MVSQASDTEKTHFGALPEEWDRFIGLGLGSDLLPVLSAPGFEVSSRSKLEEGSYSKTPSVLTREGKVAGIAAWTKLHASDGEVARWRAEPMYGLCVQTRHLRALDIDIEDRAEAERAAGLFVSHLGIMPCRFRANSGKLLLAFFMEGEHSKRIIKTEAGNIEFLADGQQFVAAGTHPTGARYDWYWSAPPVIEAEAFEATFDAVVTALDGVVIGRGRKRRVVDKAGDSAGDETGDKTADKDGDRTVAARATGNSLATGEAEGSILGIYDETATRLAAGGHVIAEGGRGQLYIECPWKANHSMDSGETETAYFPAGTGGYEQGYFVCLHAGCAHRRQDEFEDALGLRAHDFDVLPPEKDEETPMSGSGNVSASVSNANVAGRAVGRPRKNARMDAAAMAAQSGIKSVRIGSDVEIAKRLHEELGMQYGEVVYTEGCFWHYTETHWEPVPDNTLRLFAHTYDGALYNTPKGEPARVKLGKGRLDSILNELSSLMLDNAFFVDTPVGINCSNGFLRFDERGNAALEPHRKEHRCRHTLPGAWRPDNEVLGFYIPDSSLLGRLLYGTFKDDDDAADKIALLAEVCGAAALGYATRILQPRAIILKGEKAENGKSQILDLARGLLPPSAISTVTAARMGDERHVIGLAGKLLNASDEISSSSAISSEVFKAIVTGEPVDGREAYKPRVEFRPVAQHLFAGNTLPPFHGGLDRGIQRRLLVIPFNRTIPVGERVAHIGRRVAREEADLLLAWAVDGASRLIRQGIFTLPRSSQAALRDWILGADPVLAWASECVKVVDVLASAVPSRLAYEAFHEWAIAEGFKRDRLPSINIFVQRVHANLEGIASVRLATGRVFRGMVLNQPAFAVVPFEGA